MVNAWKIGGGAGAIILGLVILFNRSNLADGVFAVISLIFGVVIIATGIGLIASDK
jgi:hypothetical protein